MTRLRLTQYGRQSGAMKTPNPRPLMSFASGWGGLGGTPRGSGGPRLANFRTRQRPGIGPLTPWSSGCLASMLALG